MTYRYPADDPQYLESVELALVAHRRTGEQIGADVRRPRQALAQAWRGEAASACTHALVGFETWTDSSAQRVDHQQVAVRNYHELIRSARRAIDELRAEESWLQAASGSGPPDTQLVKHKGALDERYRTIMTGVAAASTACATVLHSMPLHTGLRPMSDPDGGTMAQFAATHPPNFPDNPAEVAAYWNSLSPQLQRAYLAAYPQLLGRVDGLPAEVRHRANMVMLPSEENYWRSEIERLERELKTADNGSLLTRLWTVTERDALIHQLRLAECKLHDVQRLRAVIADHPQAQLLVLDTSGEMVRAALGTGDLDGADNVAVLVSGFGTRVSTAMAASFDQAQDLKGVMDQFSEHGGQAPSSAVVTWMGYEAPQWENTLKPDQSVAVHRAAETGAGQLAPFLEGIEATKGQGVNLTLAGHSYGGLTAGITAARTGVIDNEVLYGAPGQGEEPSRVADGNRYSMAASNDFVVNGMDIVYRKGLRGMGQLPSQDAGFADLSVGAATGFDGRPLTASQGHSEYLSGGTTAQYNLAAVAAGHPEMIIGA